MTHAVYSLLFSEIECETESWGWWKGCGGGRLTREERMTATIIKNVLPLPYLEASLPFHLLLSNNSLVTSLHCQTPRLLTRLCHWQKEKKKEQYIVCSEQFNLVHSISWIQFYSFSMCAYSYSGPLTIKFNAFLSFSFSLSVRAQSFNNRLTPFLQPATHLPPPHPTAQVLQGHTLIVYA